MIQNFINQLQKDYKDIRRIEQDDKSLIVYAEEDTLWKILEDLRDIYNMEFEAGKEKNII